VSTTQNGCFSVQETLHGVHVDVFRAHNEREARRIWALTYVSYMCTQSWFGREREHGPPLDRHHATWLCLEGLWRASATMKSHVDRIRLTGLGRASG
jgi:hypothetical protein